MDAARRTAKSRLSAWLQARKEQRRNAELLARLAKEELRYQVLGIVAHIDGAGDGCRMSRESRLEDRLAARFSPKEKLILGFGLVFMMGFIVAGCIP